MKERHGGDVYRNNVNMDFSVSVNPLGMPEAVKRALYDAVKDSVSYPDITAENLKKAVGNMLGLPREYLLFGNGASELFMAVVHGIKPKKTVIPVPSFYGYEYAAEAVGGEVVYYGMKREGSFGREKENAFCPAEEKGFYLNEDFFEALTKDVDLLFLANPNNPTGGMVNKEYLKKLLVRCRMQKIIVVLDECFIEFCGEEQSMLKDVEQFENLILVRAFTKIFAIPGVRLGYLSCSSPVLLEKIRRQLPEWNVSGFAQAAGIACSLQENFIAGTVDYVKKERQFLEKGLKELGITVISGKANFILVYSKRPLYEKLLKRGILIRDCDNFRGLSEGFYRIAVKSREENRILLKTIGEIQWEK